MNTNFLKFQWLFILLMGLFVVSCSKNDDSAAALEAESYAEETVFRTQEGANLGRFGCYELVFPITMNFPDGSASDLIDSYEALKTVIKTWRENNPKVKTRPSIAFPYSVVNETGEVIMIEDLAAQRELRIACAKNFLGNHGPQGHNDRPKLCFKPAFPYSVSLPDGTIIALNSKEDLKTLHDAVKAYKKAHPGEKFRPVLVFPINVTLEDGTSVTLNSAEELKALKESCK
ncbi:MAG: hypothetical protein IPN89_00715 [Saprospiraceae bacterium]|nr:hypothetical protein [Saprospiraceae bacterium]